MRLALFSPLSILAALLFLFPNFSLDAKADAQTLRSALNRYRTQDRNHPPSLGGVVFTGSSSIALWGAQLKKDFPNIPTLGRGVSGTTYKYLNTHLEELVLNYAPNAVVLYSGDNDLGSFTAEAIATQAAQIVDRIHESYPNTLIYIISVKPSVVGFRRIEKLRETNQQLSALSTTRSWVTFINTFDSMVNHGPNGSISPRRELFKADGLHMRDEGYRIWACALAPFLGGTSRTCN